MNRRGPWTDPWGTPIVTGNGWDLKILSWMNWVRPERCDLNKFKGDSVIPVEASLSRWMF